MPETSQERTNVEIAREEYFHLQKTVEDFDGRALTIKAWSVTVSAAAVSAAYTEHQRILLVVGWFSALMFWIVEGRWKMFQLAYYARIRELENAFAENRILVAPRIYAGWIESWKLQRFFPVCFWPHVCLPHVGIVLGSLVLLVLDAIFGWTNGPTIVTR
jgi:uncharacterized membrane protein